MKANGSSSYNKTVAYLFKGLIVKDEAERERILHDAETKSTREMLGKLIEQDENIVSAVNDDYIKSVEINENLNREIMNVDSNLSKVKLTQKVSSVMGGDTFFTEIDKKITEMNVKKGGNIAENAKAKLETEKLDKKRREHVDTLKNIGAEKKVWLDQLEEGALRDLTYEDGFNNSFEHDYEYKVFLLIFEGIFLEKVHEAIDRTLSIKGKTLGWDCMNDEQEEARREASEKELKAKLETISPLEREREELSWKREEEAHKIELEKKRQVTREEWKKHFKRFWEPKNITKLAEKREEIDFNYNLYVTTTKEVVFSFFKRICFNAWHFKNIFLCAEEFILVEYFKRYLLNLLDRNVRPDREDEEALGILMNLLANFKDIAEMLSVDEKDRPLVLERVNSNVTIGEAIREINEVRKNANQKLVKRVKVKHLNDIFLPAMLAIRTIIFMTIGNKRIKTYVDGCQKVIGIFLYI